MDYSHALRQLLKDHPALALEAQRIFFEGATKLDNPEALSIKTNTYERVYKAVKAIADKRPKD